MLIIDKSFDLQSRKRICDKTNQRITTLGNTFVTRLITELVSSLWEKLHCIDFTLALGLGSFGIVLSNYCPTIFVYT